MLIQTVIRHGEQIIIKDVMNEATGEKISLNVAQYISYDLGLDQLQFANPLYNRILAEAVEHSTDADFHAENYFTHHPDLSISTLATSMSMDEFQLSESMQVKERENTLRDHVMHVLLDFRFEYLESRIKQLMLQLKSPLPMEEQGRIMEEYAKLKPIRDAVAKKLGRP